MINIAVASDLHAAEAGSSASFLVEGGSRLSWKSHPIEALRRLIQREGLRADFLMCPGDFAHQCSLRGLTLAWDSVAEIATALGAVGVGTIGNHDVDSHHTHGSDVFAPARAVAPTFPVGDPLANDAYWRDGYAIVEVGAAAFLVLNSATHHATASEIDHGAVDHNLLDPLDDALARLSRPVLRIALVHHHPLLHEEFGLGTGDVMHGGQELLDLLARRGFQLIIHGHKHHPRLVYAAGDSTSPVVFAAGSLARVNYAQLASNTRNLFHVITVASSSRVDCTVMGAIKSWEFNCGIGWNPATVQSAGFPFYAGFGCRTTSALLVAEVAPLIGRGKNWSDLLTQVPCLAYALPATRETLLATLSLDHGVQVLRNELGEPVGLAPV